MPQRSLLFGGALMIGTLLVIRAIVSRRHAGIFQEMAQASQQLLHR